MVAAKRSAPSKEDVVMESATPNNTVDNMDALLSNSAKKTRIMFSTAYSQAAMDEQER
jgi:pleiotropic regulator 1